MLSEWPGLNENDYLNAPVFNFCALAEKTDEGRHFEGSYLAQSKSITRFHSFQFSLTYILDFKMKDPISDSYNLTIPIILKFVKWLEGIVNYSMILAKPNGVGYKLN